MARRVLNTQITSSDAFLDMPFSAQALYLHLNLAADDDGVINRPKSIARQVGASQQDLDLLIEKRFLLWFEKEGVVVVKHWKIHNTIRSDRYKPSEYRDVMAQLTEKDNKAYTLRSQTVPEPDTDGIQNGNQMYTNGIPTGNQMDTNGIQTVSVSQDKLSQENIRQDKTERAPAPAQPTFHDVEEFCTERSLIVRPRRFWKYYTERGWQTQDGRPIEDWQGLLLRWDKQDRGSASDEIDPLVLQTLENMGVTG